MIKNIVEKYHLTYRLFYAILGASLFVGIGIGANAIPEAYYKYFDTTKYVEYLEPISFDKKVYRPCETQTAKTKLRILIDTPADIRSRMYLVLDQGNSNFKVVKEYTFNTFLRKEEQDQTLFSEIDLPCNLSHGVYFYRGVLSYYVHGIEKSAGFDSDPFSVDGSE